jgi:hypothetical protein
VGWPVTAMAGAGGEIVGCEVAGRCVTRVVCRSNILVSIVPKVARGLPPCAPARQGKSILTVKDDNRKAFHRSSSTI